MKTTIKNTFEAVLEYLNGLDNSELVNIHNEYCQNNGYSDDEIYNNDEDFFNTFFDGKVMEALRATHYGRFNFSDDFIKFNGYGNLITFSDTSDEIDLNAIANDIQENPHNYYGIELEDEEETEED